jgi:hypothetical protein
MKLQSIQTAISGDGADPGFVFVNEHTNTGNEGREGSNDFGCLPGGNITGAFAIEHKAQRICTVFHGSKSVSERSDTADFNSGSHLPKSDVPILRVVCDAPSMES